MQVSPSLVRVALVRVEQFYPLDVEELAAALSTAGEEPTAAQALAADAPDLARALVAAATALARLASERRS